MLNMANNFVCGKSLFCCLSRQVCMWLEIMFSTLSAQKHGRTCHQDVGLLLLISLTVGSTSLLLTQAIGEKEEDWNQDGVV